MRDAGAAGKCKYLHELNIDGEPNGGSVSVDIANVLIAVPTDPGDTIDDVRAAVADAINQDPTLQSLGISAVRIGSAVVIANAPVEDASTTDSGLTVTLTVPPYPAPTAVPSLAGRWPGAVALVAALVLAMLLAREARPVLAP